MNNSVLTNGATTTTKNNELNGGIEMTNVLTLGAQTEGTTTNKRAVIDKPELLMPFAKVLKAKKYITILSIEVKRDKYKKYVGIINTTPAPIGRAYSKHTKEKEIVVPVGKSGYQTITEDSFAPFVKDFMSVKFYSEDDIKTSQDDGIYVLYAGRKTMACLFNRTKNVWVDIRNGVEYSVKELEDLAIEYNGDLRLHKAFVYSPSDIRNFSYAAKDVTNGDDRDDYLNEISNGAWNRVKLKVEKKIARNEPIDKIQLYILKSMPRFGQLKAGSVNLGAITSWAYLRKPFKTSCGETVDGTGYLRASYVAKVFSDRLKEITVTERAVVGMFIQARPDLQKGAYEVLADNVFNYMLRSQSEVEFDEEDEINGLGKAGDKALTYEGSKKNIIAPVMIVDANVVKVESDYDLNDLNFELLEIAGCSDANLSKQAYEKILFANEKEAMNYANELGQDYMTDRFTKQFINPTAKIPTIGEVKKNYPPDLTLAIAPKMITQSIPLYKSNLINTVQSFVNSLDKLKYTIPGNNVRLTSDAAEIILNKLGREFAAIKYGEIYMPAAVDYFRRYYKAEAVKVADEKGLIDDVKKKFVLSYIDKKVNNTKTCMIKYPSMGPKEFYLGRVLTLRTIFTRIDNMPLDDEAKAILKDYYRGTGKSLSKLPAVKLVMFQCAGLDYDYDGAEFIYDQKFVNILDNKNYKLEATLIASMDKIKSEFELIKDELEVAITK